MTANVNPKATADRLRGLAERGYLPPPALERALQLAGFIPDGLAWQKFLDYLLLILGAAFTLSGIFFFFAYNWADLHHFVKFGLIEAVLLITVGAAFILGLDALAGKIALTAAALLTGALLAVFGQVYQTGADAYTLFLYWTALITGWVLISRYAPLWLGWLVLMNITLITYWLQVVNDDNAALFVLLALLNGTALAAWEVAQQQDVAWLQQRWPLWLINLATFISLVSPTVVLILSLGRYNSLDPYLVVAGGLYLLFTAIVVIFYWRQVHDLFMLTAAAFSLIVIITTGFVRLFDSAFLEGAAPLLVLSLIVIGQAGLAVQWLRKIAKSWEMSNA